MNRTEAEFARMLEQRVRDGALQSFDYEGLSLRFGGMIYTPDFVAVESVTHVPPINEDTFPHVRLVFYEVKGGHIWPKDMVKFKAARHNYPLFRFELWQKKAGEWKKMI